MPVRNVSGKREVWCLFVQDNTQQGFVDLNSPL
jgi:hypothetical protein